VPIIRHHHERWDGRGYPDRMAGNAIPLLARVLAVTDAFDAMTSTRSYRQAMTIDAALAEMLRCSGTQFDPEICAHWIDGVRRGAFKIEEVHPPAPIDIQAASA
jgi:HD-GYP domain-containing protein (c-di-GMP phosphodiesterase class II)